MKNVVAKVANKPPADLRRIPDLVARVRYAGGDEVFYLVHVETRSGRRTGVARRMSFYWRRMHARSRSIPAYSVALFVHDGKAVEPDTYTMGFPDFEVLRFQFEATQLSRKSWKDYLEYPSPLAVALMPKMAHEREERPHVKLACMRRLADLRPAAQQHRLIAELVDTFLSLDVEEDAEYQELVETLPAAERQAVRAL